MDEVVAPNPYYSCDVHRHYDSHILSYKVNEMHDDILYKQEFLIPIVAHGSRGIHGIEL